MMTLKNNLRVLGMMVAALAALPTTAAFAADRNDGRAGRQEVVAPQVHEQFRTAAPQRNDDRRVADNRRDDNRRDDDRGRVSVQFGWGRPTVTQTWVPGHFETRIERVLVEDAHYVLQTEQVLVSPARWVERYVPAVAETRRDYRGRLITVIVEPARTERVLVPAQYETRTTRVLVPARFEDREVRTWVDGCFVTEPGPVRPMLRIGGLFGW